MNVEIITARVDIKRLWHERFIMHHYKQGGQYLPRVRYAAVAKTTDGEPVGMGLFGSPVLQMARSRAFGALCRSADRRRMDAGRLNETLTTFFRLVVDPRFRGCGLATDLIRHGVAHANTPYVEAYAMMGRYNRVFVRSGGVDYGSSKSLVIGRWQRVAARLGTRPSIDDIRALITTDTDARRAALAVIKEQVKRHKGTAGSEDERLAVLQSAACYEPASLFVWDVTKIRAELLLTAAGPL